MNATFLVMALICAVVGIVASAAVTSYVAKRGIKINYFLWRLMIFKYFDDYRQLTKEEIGHTGPWHTVFLAAMALSLVFVIIGLIIK